MEIKSLKLNKNSGWIDVLKPNLPGMTEEELVLIGLKNFDNVINKWRLQDLPFLHDFDTNVLGAVTAAFSAGMIYGFYAGDDVFDD